MRILINDKPVDALTPKHEKSFMLSKVQQDAKATVLTPDEATKTYIAHTRRWFLILGGIAIVLMAGIAVVGMVGDPMDGGMIAIGAAIIGAAFVLVMYLLLGHRVRTWNRRLQHRSEDLLPAGTTLVIDAGGLTVGTELFAWPSLAVDLLELSSASLPSGDTSTLVHIIERISLRAGTKVIMLDRVMLQNGLLFVDNTWRRLRALTP